MGRPLKMEPTSKTRIDTRQTIGLTVHTDYKHSRIKQYLKEGSIIGLYKAACVRLDGPFRTVDDLEMATLSRVHWFNDHRLHSPLDYVPPIEHEQAYYRQNDPQHQPLPGEPALH